MPIKPTPKMPAKSDLAPANQNHYETQDRKQMKQIEMASQSVDAKSRDVQEDHRNYVRTAEGAMSLRSFRHQKNDASEYQTKNPAKDMNNTNYHERQA
jgi:hypothetical protein